jgi:ABC-type multidrug transport system fused ATPase/permease subunit
MVAKSVRLSEAPNVISSVLKIIEFFPTSQKRTLFLAICAQSSLAFIDLVGVGLVGAIGALAVAGVQSRSSPESLSWIIDGLRLSDQSLQFQVAGLAALATIFFVVRTLLGMFLTQRTLRYLSHRSSELSELLVTKLFNAGIGRVYSRSINEYRFTLTSGLSNLTVGVLSNVILCISDLVLLAFLSIGLFVFNPTVTLFTYLLFSAVGLALYRYLHTKASALGEVNAKLQVASLSEIDEIVLSYRENFVRNTLGSQIANLVDLRRKHSSVLAQMNFLPNFTKYIFELFIVVFIFLLSAFQFAVTDALSAVATISVFLMASSRIAPAMLRIQQAAITIKSSLGTSSQTLSLMTEVWELGTGMPLRSKNEALKDFSPFISLNQVFFRYPGSTKNALSDITLDISQGTFVAVVGPSGAGKSTLVDLLLGVLSPSRGDVKISGVDACTAPVLYPGALGYLPQEIKIYNGTVRENICLGYSSTTFSDEQVWDVLEKARAADFVRQLPDQLNSKIGEGYANLSGGERQRLGVARALVTNPSLIVLDEATSALDSQTERDLTDSLLSLRGESTLIVVAHRLSTVRNADLVIYIQEGSILAMGTFADVRSQIPDFDTQAILLGL